MKPNYGKWFYEYNKYLKTRDGDYNDTSWVNYNERFKLLYDMSSSLLDEQPFGVLANNTGFDKLIDLMGRSNYTFEDINDALIQTYRHSLQNSMSRNVTNTHAIIYSTNMFDKKNTTAEQFSGYYIIDVPFDQLHFGSRDEFIRQRLYKMYFREFNNYVDIKEFNTSSEIKDILDFSLICCANGKISNDCKVAISDKGFKFKIAWKYSSDANFIIYKLDKCDMITCEIKPSEVTKLIPYSFLGIEGDKYIGKNCILNIYDPDSKFDTAPNFGYFSSAGLNINGLQKYTTDSISRFNSKRIVINIFIPKFIKEVPNLYPAVNIYDLIDSRIVMDERSELIKDVNSNRIVASSNALPDDVNVCTPPICIDRDSSSSFKVILDAITIKDSLMSYDNDIKNVGNAILSRNTSKIIDSVNVIRNNVRSNIIDLYGLYNKFAIMTSLVDSTHIDTFEKFINNLNNLCDSYAYTPADIQRVTFDELYEDNYKIFVNTVCDILDTKKLSIFRDLGKLYTGNNFNDSDPHSIMRPISEECFICLKYDRDEECWVFTDPDVRHFNGIGNTFYINTKLTGNEIFKFFVLYSMTDSPAEKPVDSFDKETVLDFDKFCSEVEKYIGYIRYWDAENRLMKLSNILFNRYDDDTCMAVISKILKRKLDTSIMFDYPSEMTYNDANQTSDMYKEYTEYTDRGPFSINFLFYTLSMMNNNVDKLQAYLYRKITGNKFDIRYLDMNISDTLTGDTIPVSYSQYTISPTTVSDESNPSDDNRQAYYGLPIFIHDSSIDSIITGEMYRNTFNVIDDTEFPIISDNDVDPTYYLKYNDITEHHGLVISYKDTIKYAQLVAEYLRAVYDLLGIVLTNYTISFNQTSDLQSFIDKSHVIKDKLIALMDEKHIEDIPGIASTNGIHELIIDYNDFVNTVQELKFYIYLVYSKIGRSRPIMKLIDEAIIPTLRKVYKDNGFTDDGKMRARALYLHLKKINDPMNCYTFKKWLLEIDTTTLGNLDSMVSNNSSNSYSPTLFSDLNNELVGYIDRVAISTNPSTGKCLLDDIDFLYKDLNGSVKTSFIDPLTEYCNDVITKLIFPLYKIASIDIDPISYVGIKPGYCLINISSSDHINDPIISTGISSTTIIAQPIYESTDDTHHTIKSISMITDYCFFNGETLSGCTMNIIGETGTSLLSTTVDLNFIQISTTADDINTFNKILNCNTTVLDFENPHESFDIHNDMIVNKKHADMNYELLCGNAFETLPHEIEYILTPNTWAEKSVDRVFMENQMINTFADIEFAHSNCYGVYFKPAYVLHITPNLNGSIDSIYGKFFEGETIYLSTDDDRIFPVKITKVDHSINKGFIEASVDSYNSKWFKIEDNETITKYLTTDIECTVLDDNVRNFLNEYTDNLALNFYHPDVVKDPDQYELPGDPIYVNNNKDYVHTRLNWIFNDTIQNRFIDEDHKQYDFTYITKGFINDASEDVINIKMINFNFDDRNIVEQYPVLRSEPNDHDIWEEEIRRFNEEISLLQDKELVNEINLETHLSDLESATTVFEKQRLADLIDIDYIRIDSCNEDIRRMERMIAQLESPTTWFNVRSYEATLVYIDNGRADTFSPAFVSNIRDAIYTDDLEVWLYDCDHKQWMDPSTYHIDTTMLDNMRIDECEDYTTNRVLYSVSIVPDNGFVESSCILVYFAYKKSNVYDDIVMNDDTCYVRFKPALSIDKPITDYNPYAHLYIREHFDGYEKYKIDAGDELIINRIKRNGKYINPPQFRLCDITISANDNEYTYENIVNIFVKEPFNGLSTFRTFSELTYSATIHANIDDFVDGANVNLICISNNNQSSYDGHISSVMFTGTLSLDQYDRQTITINSSTLPNNFITNTHFICTVFRDDGYPCIGGVIEITVSRNTTANVYGDDGWYKIPANYMLYRELPETFKLELNTPIITDAYVTLSNSYHDDYTDTIESDNSGLHNMSEYYYDDKNHHRLPISDTRINDHKSRLVIDTTLNPDVKIVKSTYLGICRYSLNRIPDNGLIDLTGYIPTPLSRDRYEFWINGRCLKDDNFIILSPTVIQLINLKSLRHFECIELIDDIDTNSELFKNGTVYTDINGNTYSNYKLALLSNSRIASQRITFTFNANNNAGIHSYTKNIIPNPNNNDFEEDILANVNFDDSSLDYNKIMNLPSINGVTIYHPTLFDLGIREVDNSLIVKELDKVWKYEVLLNPLFPKTHIDVKNTYSKIIVKETDDAYEIHVNGFNNKYFTLYISNVSNGNIDDVNNTIKIIPFVTNGDTILIDKEFKGKWICATDPKIHPSEIE